MLKDCGEPLNHAAKTNLKRLVGPYQCHHLERSPDRRACAIYVRTKRTRLCWRGRSLTNLSSERWIWSPASAQRNFSLRSPWKGSANMPQDDEERHDAWPGAERSRIRPSHPHEEDLSHDRKPCATNSAAESDCSHYHRVQFGLLSMVQHHSGIANVKRPDHHLWRALHASSQGTESQHLVAMNQ